MKPETSTNTADASRVGSTGGSAFAGHTPGPWVLDYDKGSTQDILSLKHGGICTVRRAGRHDSATFAANAHLIAAAPDLLRVLGRLHAAVSARMGADEPTGEQRLELLKAWEEAGNLLSPNADVSREA